MSMVFSGRMVVLMPLVVSLSVTGRQVDGFLRSYGSSNATRCELVSDLRHVGGFLRFPPPIELNVTILLKYY